MKTNHFRIVLLGTLTLAGTTGCGIHMAGTNQNELSSSTQCQLPADQSGTLNGRWITGPIPVAFPAAGVTGAFMQSDMPTFLAAYDTWNAFFGAQGGAVFNYGNAANVYTTQSPPSSYDTCNGGLPITDGNTFTSMVNVYKITSGWPTELGSDILAITYVSYSTASPLNSITCATTNFNFQNYGLAGGSLPVPDWQTVATHEAGHVLGLAHSCYTDGTTPIPGMPDCAANTNYAGALMTPVLFNLSTNSASVIRSLDLNTEQRANCLY